MSRTHSLHMFPRNVLAEPKYVPPVDDSPSRSLASPPLSPLPTQTMICTISSLRININPNNTPQSLKSFEKIPDIHPGAGSRLMGIREEGKIHTSFALSSALNSTPNTLLSAPTPLWNPSTSQIRPILTLASAQATEVANKPIFCIFCNVRPLIQYLIELLSFGALHDAPRREPLLATAPLFGFPITVPPSSWITVYPDPPSSASTSQPSSTRSRRESASLPSISKSSIITSASTSISSNIPSTYTDSSSPSSSLTLPPNSSSSTSLSTSASSSVISLLSSSPISTSQLPPSPSRTTKSSRPLLTIHLSFPRTSASTKVVTSTRLATIYHSTTRGHHGDTTSIEPGVLSTSNPKGSDGFARNTAAIVGVAVACTILIIVAVIATFFACKRYKGRRAFGVSSPNVLRFTPWHPPLAGDDDNHYYTEQHGGLVTTSSQQHLERHAQPNEMASIGTERLSPERSVTHGGGSSDSGLSQPIPHPCFGQQSSVSYTRATDIALPFPYTAYMPSVPPPMSRPGPPNDISDSVRQQGDASNGAPSLHGGSSSHGHFATSTSSGHELLPAKALPSQSSPGPTSFKTLMGRLRPGRISLPDIVVHGSSSNSSPCESVSSYMRNLPPLLPGNSSLARPNTPTLDPPLSTWTPAILPPLPSPTATENSRMLEDLLTPHLGVQRTSSEQSSLRDYVDYSRPISGLVRNRLYSTVTTQTEDTATIRDAKEKSSFNHD